MQSAKCTVYWPLVGRPLSVISFDREFGRESPLVPNIVVVEGLDNGAQFRPIKERCFGRV